MCGKWGKLVHLWREAEPVLAIFEILFSELFLKVRTVLFRNVRYNCI